MSTTIIEKLKVDDNYYGDFGSAWLSNSDIDTLINNPKNFGKPKEETKAMVEGRFLHTLLLEPVKLSSFKSKKTLSSQNYALQRTSPSALKQDLKWK